MDRNHSFCVTKANDSETYATVTIFIWEKTLSGNTDTDAKILVKCARHCCLCRKFKPTQLHIHHIVSRADGGSNSEDNLAPLCTECHGAVHSKMSMTKNISAEEIRMARDKLYELVQSGQLHGATTISESEIDGIANAISKKLNEHSENKFSLSRRATSILLAVVAEQESLEVIPMSVSTVGSNKPPEIITHLKCGLQQFYFGNLIYPELPNELKDLMRLELLKQNGSKFDLTSKALTFFDVISVDEGIPGYFVKKIQCDDCSLHFTILIWHLHKHKRGNLHCPECGQNAGRFYISVQREAGFIFQSVPGNASMYQE